jgi:hypothetical protein
VKLTRHIQNTDGAPRPASISKSRTMMSPSNLPRQGDNEKQSLVRRHARNESDYFTDRMH